MYKWLDERLNLGRLRKKFLRKAFPVHHSFYLGELTLVAFVVLVLTGFFLTMMYEPSSRLITTPAGLVPAATASVVYIDSLPFGRVLRSVHHWSAHLMIAVGGLHLLRIFLTGAYKKPREINWWVGIGLLVLTVVGAFTGFALPFDSFAITAAKIGYGIADAIPWVGGWLATVFFAGRYPTTHSLPRLLPIHVLWIPLLVTSLIGIHLLVMVKQKHTQPGWARLQAPGKIVGVPLVPQQSAMILVLLFLYLGVVFILGGLFTVHPVEAVASAAESSAIMRPDWYFLWVYGLLQMTPASWHWHWLGAEIGPEFIGGVLLPMLVVAPVVLVPLLDRRAAPMLYAEQPTLHPWRTGLAVGFVAFLFVAALAGYHEDLKWPIPLFWGLLLAGPPSLALGVRAALGRLFAPKGLALEKFA
jgi:cytochrome b-561